ncbi:MAG: Unknown protein [uncultured Campylobacterales bacterium]|uniref:Uncharacterized protein n=1 Tax=uncultured Campylobacterales bacterium TaxID=352960 RepID=A0A6S6T630_9BACT|nr:MAG: Unknown protein [uncultured Campylobacterales bacterium]
MKILNASKINFTLTPSKGIEITDDIKSADIVVIEGKENYLKYKSNFTDKMRYILIYPFDFEGQRPKSDMDIIKKELSNYIIIDRNIAKEFKPKPPKNIFEKLFKSKEISIKESFEMFEEIIWKEVEKIKGKNIGI